MHYTFSLRYSSLRLMLLSHLLLTSKNLFPPSSKFHFERTRLIVFRNTILQTLRRHRTTAFFIIFNDRNFYKAASVPSPLVQNRFTSRVYYFTKRVMTSCSDAIRGIALYTAFLCYTHYIMHMRVF